MFRRLLVLLALFSVGIASSEIASLQLAGGADPAAVAGDPLDAGVQNARLDANPLMPEGIDSHMPSISKA